MHSAPPSATKVENLNPATHETALNCRCVGRLLHVRLQVRAPDSGGDWHSCIRLAVVVGVRGVEGRVQGHRHVPVHAHRRVEEALEVRERHVALGEGGGGRRQCREYGLLVWIWGSEVWRVYMYNDRIGRLINRDGEVDS